jgi:hypothetical protein
MKFVRIGDFRIGDNTPKEVQEASSSSSFGGLQNVQGNFSLPRTRLKIILGW